MKRPSQVMALLYAALRITELIIMKHVIRNVEKVIGYNLRISKRNA